MTRFKADIPARLPRGGLAIASSPARGRVAMRAGLTVLAALSALAYYDHLDYSAYATFGAFASVYAEGRAPSVRWRTQASVGMVLTVAVATGAAVGTSSQRSWWVVPIATLWAAAASLASDRYAWKPPGPLFPVFAFATCAAIPTAPSTVSAAAAVAATTAFLAVALGAIDARLTDHRGPSVPEPVERATKSHQRAFRCALAVFTAGVIATASPLSHPYWAMIAAVVPLSAPNFEAQLLRGFHRTAGTVVGLAVAAALLAPELPIPMLIVVVALLQVVTELLVTRNYGLALIAITPLALLVSHAAHPEPLGSLLTARLVETVLGVAVGLGVALLFRAEAPDPATTQETH